MLGLMSSTSSPTAPLRTLSVSSPEMKGDMQLTVDDAATDASACSEHVPVRNKGMLDLPIALAAAALLGLGRVSVGMAGLAKILGKAGFALSSAIGNAGVVAVGVLVRASHWVGQSASVIQLHSWGL